LRLRRHSRISSRRILSLVERCCLFHLELRRPM
jgi:hypothetical protein